MRMNRCRVVASPIVGRVQLAPFGLEPEPLDRFNPCMEIFTLAGRDRLTSANVDRTPSAEFPHVFDDDALHAQFGQPGDDVPWVAALLIARRLAASRYRMMCACWRGHQQVEVALRHEDVRPNGSNVLDVVASLRMVSLMRIDRSWPVIHTDQLHFKAKFLQCALCTS